MIGAIGGSEWFESCARGLRPEVAAGPCSMCPQMKVSAADRAADDCTHVRPRACRMLVGAGGALKSALELRLRPREEGGQPPWRLAVK